MAGVNPTYVETLLEGVPLPASRAELVAYARTQPGGERVAELVAGLPEREYRSVNEVGEALAPVQPERGGEVPHVPRAESGAPPGGDAYTRPSR
jgi:hypothetical protein